MSVNIIRSKDLKTYLISRNLREIVIDAENSILGRLASLVAKLAKLGFSVHVVNVEKCVITGKRSMVISSYKLLLNVRTHKNPYRHTMKRPRTPTAIFKKAVKNMLPKHNWLGLQSLKRVKCYIGVPEDMKNRDKIKILDTDASFLGRRNIVTVAEIAKELGWRTRR
ncbi:MAG: 50S ribosomal protein L13 [Ignisphaera sp.]|uniref:Large ribosomal subunit protein uL13 n=1 Tax=Ignisphaera aggregans TaxID=334771 RepID=A0A7J3MZ86_9CREN